MTVTVNSSVLSRSINLLSSCILSQAALSSSSNAPEWAIQTNSVFVQDQPAVIKGIWGGFCGLLLQHLCINSWMSQVVCTIMTKSIHFTEWIKWKSVDTMLLPQKTAPNSNFTLSLLCWVGSFAPAAEKWDGWMQWNSSNKPSNGLNQRQTQHACSYNVWYHCKDMLYLCLCNQTKIKQRSYFNSVLVSLSFLRYRTVFCLFSFLCVLWSNQHYWLCLQGRV